MADIHPTAIIDPSAEIADDVKIGPYCVVGAKVKLGAGCVLHSHVVLGGPSVFGKGNEFFPFSVIGLKSQDLKYEGEPTFLEVGDYNVFRENSNINRSTTADQKTIIGSHNLFLINSHCGHECIVGDHCIFSGYAGVAGHCEIGDWAIVSGFAALHQFVRVGAHALIAGCTRVTQDVPPYMIVEGSPPAVRAYNSIGMRRRGHSEEDILAVKQGFKKLFHQKSGSLDEKIAILEADEKYGSNPCLQKLIQFVKSSERGFIH